MEGEILEMSRRPLIKLALALAFGIMAASVSGWFCAVIGVGGLLSVSLALFTRRRMWGEIGLLCAFCVFGAGDFLLHTRTAPNDASLLAPQFITLTGVVNSDVERLSRQGGTSDFARLTLKAGQAVLSSDPSASPLQVSGNIDVRLAMSRRNRETEVSRNLPRYGDILVVRGRLELPEGPRNPGGFDSRSFLSHRGIHSVLSVLRPEDWSLSAPAASLDSPFRTLAYRLRQGVLDHARRSFTPERAALLSGILLGDRANLPAETRDDFERTGTTHILATAGLHVGAVTALLLGLLRLLRLPRRAALLLTLCGLLLYIPMSGERTAVARAVIMAAVYLLGIVLEREPDLPNTLALAALILLVADPLQLFEAGFQLSFAIVITIALLLPLWYSSRKRLERSLPSSLRPVGEVVLGMLLLTLAAQMGAFPLTAYYFHEVSLSGLLANALIVPVVLPILGLGFAASAAGSLHPLLALPLDKILDLLLGYILHITHLCASPSWAVLPTGEISPFVVILCYALLWGGAAFLLHKHRSNTNTPFDEC